MTDRSVKFDVKSLSVGFVNYRDNEYSLLNIYAVNFGQLNSNYLDFKIKKRNRSQVQKICSIFSHRNEIPQKKNKNFFSVACSVSVG